MNNMKNRLLVVLMLLIMILMVILFSLFAYTETRCNVLKDNYSFLESKYEALNKSQDTDYEILSTNYNNLERNFDILYTKYYNLFKDYNIYKDSADQYNTLLIDHLMSLTYSEIRGGAST